MEKADVVCAVSKFHVILGLIVSLYLIYNELKVRPKDL